MKTINNNKTSSVSGNRMKLSGIIIANNAQDTIVDCLESLSFCDELILVDTGITDETVELAKRIGSKVVECKKGSFDTWRNCGLCEASCEWVLYIDTDEKVTKELKDEILMKIKDISKYTAYAIPRSNYILGKLFKYSGEYPDYQKRLFRRSHLKKWRGELHEEPVVDGKLGHLSSSIIHIKHDNFSDMIEKTNIWSEKEAKLLFDSNHPQMVPWRFLRIIVTEGFNKLIRRKAFMDGYAGVMYGIYQIWSRVLTYAKPWEMQNSQESNNKIQKTD